MTLILDSLKFGDLNTIEENDDSHIGDRRRTTPLTALRFATEKAFEKDTLRGVSEFVGVIVGAREIKYATHEYQGTLINTSLLPAPMQSDPRPRGSTNMLYRVYIPELEPLPAPKSYNDPVLMAYREIPIDTITMPNDIKLIQGDVVKIRYQDANNLFGPKIIKKISITTPEWDIQSAGDAQRLTTQQVTQESAPATTTPATPEPDPEPAPPFITKKEKVKKKPFKAPGTIKSNIGIIYIPTMTRVFNGKLLEANIPLSKIQIPNRANTSTSYKLASPEIVDDLQSMIQAYNEAFNGTSFPGVDNFRLYGGNGSAYRNFAEQKYLEDKNCWSDKEGGREGGFRKKCSPSTARTGTSKHGWGVAIDLATAKMIGNSLSTSTARSNWKADINAAYAANGKMGGDRLKRTIQRLMRAQSIKWRWLNKYGKDFNFVFTVPSEAWHMESLRLDQVYMRGKRATPRERSSIRTPTRPNSFREGVSILTIGSMTKPWEGAAAGYGPYGSNNPEFGTFSDRANLVALLGSNAPVLLD